MRASGTDYGGCGAANNGDNGNVMSVECDDDDDEQQPGWPLLVNLGSAPCRMDASSYLWNDSRRDQLITPARVIKEREEKREAATLCNTRLSQFLLYHNSTSRPPHTNSLINK